MDHDRRDDNRDSGGGSENKYIFTEHSHSLLADIRVTVDACVTCELRLYCLLFSEYLFSNVIYIKKEWLLYLFVIPLLSLTILTLYWIKL